MFIIFIREQSNLFLKNSNNILIVQFIIRIIDFIFIYQSKIFEHDYSKNQQHKDYFLHQMINLWDHSIDLVVVLYHFRLQ